MFPWEFKRRSKITQDLKKENPIASKSYIFKEDAIHFVVKDKEHPYEQGKTF